MPLRIVGMGTALPPNQITQTDAVEIAARFGFHSSEQREFLRGIYLGAGIQSRGSVLLEDDPHERDTTDDPGMRQEFFRPAFHADDRGPTTAERLGKYCLHAPDLAEEACLAAFAEARVDPRSITHLITVSCTGFHAPGVDIQLIERLKLPRHVARTHVGYMGCHGSLNALRVANAFVDADPNAVVLLVSVELCSLHLQYGTEPAKVVSHALFADGAGAIIATHRSRPVGTATTMERQQNADDWSLRANGSLILPDSQEDMGWQIGDHGFEMTLSPRIPELIGLNLRPWITEWLSKLKLEMSDIRSWAIHPGGPKILKACARALQLSRRDVVISEEVLSKHGNMSSATLLFIIQRMRAQHAPRPCIAMGFGPGLCFEAALWD